jgi:hypothetical protein
MFLRLASHYREAYSMMGGGWYDATDITQGMSVNMLFLEFFQNLLSLGVIFFFVY